MANWAHIRRDDPERQRRLENLMAACRADLGVVDGTPWAVLEDPELPDNYEPQAP
jgi:hypothetical protein